MIQRFVEKERLIVNHVIGSYMEYLGCQVYLELKKTWVSSLLGGQENLDAKFTWKSRKLGCQVYLEVKKSLYINRGHVIV